MGGTRGHGHKASMQGWAVPEATWKDYLVSERRSLSRSVGAALEGASGAVISFVFPGTPGGSPARPTCLPSWQHLWGPHWEL